MGCGCADRMRKHVLPLAGYEYAVERVGWTRDTEFISDAEVEKHHTKLVLSNPELFEAAVVAGVKSVQRKAIDLSNLLNKEGSNVKNG